VSHSWIPCLLLVLDLTGALAAYSPANAQAATSPVQNANPNYAAIREYSDSSATLVAGGSRPLDMAALTLATCLGLAIYDFGLGNLITISA
jgi:hypothetical protein